MKTIEWVVYLNGNRLNHFGFYCSSSCVTAYTKKQALKILSKAKKYYFGTYRLNDAIKKNTYLKYN